MLAHPPVYKCSWEDDTTSKIASARISVRTADQECMAVGDARKEARLESYSSERQSSNYTPCDHRQIVDERRAISPYNSSNVWCHCSSLAIHDTPSCIVGMLVGRLVNSLCRLKEHGREFGSVYTT